MKVFLVMCLFIFSCKESMSDSGKIRATLTDQKLKIENLADEEMYYIVLTDESIAYTDWRPFIKSFSSKIEANSSLKVDAQKTEKMKEFIIYFWYASDDLNNDGVADKTRSIRISK